MLDSSSNATVCLCLLTVICVICRVCPQDQDFLVVESSRGPFLKGPEKFSHTESHSKISNLRITELFYSHILNMNRGSLHARLFRRIHLSFTGP